MTRKPRCWAHEGCKGADGKPDPDKFCANCKTVNHERFWGRRDGGTIKRHFGKIGPCLRPTARGRGKRKRGSEAAAAGGSPADVAARARRTTRSPVDVMMDEERDSITTSEQRGGHRAAPSDHTLTGNRGFALGAGSLQDARRDAALDLNERLLEVRVAQGGIDSLRGRSRARYLRMQKERAARDAAARAARGRAERSELERAVSQARAVLNEARADLVGEGDAMDTEFDVVAYAAAHAFVCENATDSEDSSGDEDEDEDEAEVRDVSPDALVAETQEAVTLQERYAAAQEQVCAALQELCQSSCQYADEEESAAQFVRWSEGSRSELRRAKKKLRKLQRKVQRNIVYREVLS